MDSNKKYQLTESLKFLSKLGSFECKAGEAFIRCTERGCSVYLGLDRIVVNVKSEVAIGVFLESINH